MGKFRQSDSLSTVSVKKRWLENPNRPAHIEFFEHFEIVEMVTYKILIARCKKLNGQLFLLKMLTNSVAFNEKDAKSELRRKRLRMNQDASLDFNEAVESWVNTVP